MATKRLTKQMLEDAIWKATVLALGLDAGRDDVQKRVRINWPTYETASSNWHREENVVFLQIVPDVDDYSNLHDCIYEPDPETGVTKEIIAYHRCYSVSWICYGPDADNDADTIRIGILRDNVRQYLRKYHLAFQPHILNPSRVPEPDETGEWWERCDLTAQCYELVRREYTAEEMLVAPNTIITTE